MRIKYKTFYPVKPEGLFWPHCVRSKYTFTPFCWSLISLKMTVISALWLENVPVFVVLTRCGVVTVTQPQWNVSSWPPWQDESLSLNIPALLIFTAETRTVKTLCSSGVSHLSIFFSSSEQFGEPEPETSGASPVSSKCTVTKTQRKNSPNRAGTLTTHRRSNGNKNLNISGAIFPWRIRAGGVERCAQDTRGRKTGFVFQIHFRSSEYPRD